MGDSHEPTVDRRTFLRSTGAAGGAVALGGVGSAQELGDDHEILVGVSAAGDMDAVAASVPAGAEVVHRNDTLRYLTVRLPSDAGWLTRSSVEAQMGMQPEVRYTEDNGRLHAFEVDPEAALDAAPDDRTAAVEPDDPRYDEQYYPEQVNAPEAWETTQGSRDVTIGIVDTGADYEHPDLAPQFADDPGRDFVDGDDDPMPARADHGTHVAGLASAATGNGVGVAGTSDSTLISARVLGGRGGGARAVADGIQYCADRGCDVINLSLGASRSFETVGQAISYAQDQGVLVVAAAGNSSTDRPHYPAAREGVVGVSAVGEDEELARFSNYGDYVDVTGPGVRVLSTFPDGEYERISGTSMSSPVVAGVAALGLAAYPDLSATELRSRLKETATDIGLPREEQGAGQVDAAAIVEGGTGGGGGGGGGDGEAPVPDMSVSARSVDTGDPVEFDGSLSFDLGGVVDSYRWEFGDGTTATGPTVTHSYADPGQYTVTLTVTDDGGASATTTASISVDGAPTDDPGGGESGTVETTETATIDGVGDTAAFTYATRTAEPASVTVSMTGPSGADFDMYLTHDGRTPTSTDYDQRAWSFGADETIEVADRAVSAGAEFGVLVYGYSGSGQFTLTITEEGSGGSGDTGGSGDDGGDADGQPPVARINPETRQAEVGQALGFDAILASDPDGRVQSYEWAFGDGATATGPIVEHSYAADGRYTVTLTVTDDDGNTASESVDVVVGDGGDTGGAPGGGAGGGTCGATTATDSMTGSLETSFGESTFVYESQLDSPCQIAVSLSGPAGADFDLFANGDGSTPGSFSYDKSSTTPDSNEQVLFEDVTSGQEIGLLVQSWSGTGQFTVEIEETGK